MATINVAVRQDGYPRFDLLQELDGRVYQLFFYWNEREEYWYMDLGTDAGDPIQTGIKIVVNWPLLRRVTDDRRPPGEILALDQTLQDADPAQLELGNRVTMVYQEAADL